jgi:hypothetical protein
VVISTSKDGIWGDYKLNATIPIQNIILDNTFLNSSIVQYSRFSKVQYENLRLIILKKESYLS